MRRMLVVTVFLLSGALLQAAEYEGRLEWSQKTALGFSVSGVIESVPAGPGQRVKQGDALVALDRREFEARSKEAEAVLAARKEDQAEAERELVRATELYDRNQLSDHEKQLAVIGAARANGELAAAQAAKTLADLELERSLLKAPFDGWVLRLDATPGQAILSRCTLTPLLVIARSGQMEAKIRVPLSGLDGLKIGGESRVVAAGKDLAGKIRALGMEALEGYKDREPLYEVAVTFEVPEGLVLREGMVVRVDL